jgi:hypothetical protein
MKKILALAIALCLSTSLPARAEVDEFMDSNWFEPTVMCAVGGGAGYAYSSQNDQNNEAAYIAVGCLATGLITYAINKHYESKYTKSYNKKIDRLSENLRQFQELEAQKAANADEGPYSIRVREIVPAQLLPNGQVRAPTVSEKLVVPGQDLGD